MMDDSRLHCILQTSHPVVSGNMEPEVEGSGYDLRSVSM